MELFTQQKEMNNWICPTFKHEWNYAMHVLHKFLGFGISTTAQHLGRLSLHLVLRKNYMAQHFMLKTKEMFPSQFDKYLFKLETVGRSFTDDENNEYFCISLVLRWNASKMNRFVWVRDIEREKERKPTYK